MRRSGEISARIEAVQSGRSAMDTMTRELRSQVCIPRVDQPGRRACRSTTATPTRSSMFTDLRDTIAQAPRPRRRPRRAPIIGPTRREVSFERQRHASSRRSGRRPASATASTASRRRPRTRELLVNRSSRRKTADGRRATSPSSSTSSSTSTTAAAASPPSRSPLIGTGTDGALSAEQINVDREDQDHLQGQSRRSSARTAAPPPCSPTRCSPATSTPTPTRTS